eukprot:m.62084 g.62084  ORF g.62084 m.62084 type:complete len:77 (-) comp11893_c0_seq2:821-1051(-)
MHVSRHYDHAICTVFQLRIQIIQPRKQSFKAFQFKCTVLVEKILTINKVDYLSFPAKETASATNVKVLIVRCKQPY